MRLVTVSVPGSSGAPGKRMNMAAGPKAQGPKRKAVRAGNDEGSGPLVACVRPWECDLGVPRTAVDMFKVGDIYIYVR